VIVAEEGLALFLLAQDVPDPYLGPKIGYPD
jgi:hypothetical protein